MINRHGELRDFLRKLQIIASILANFFGSLIRIGKGVLTQCRLLTLSKEFSSLGLGSLAMQKLLREYQFQTVLDLGCGEGKHSDIFLKYGKNLSAIDIGRSVFFEKNKGNLKVIIGDFNTIDMTEKYDCVWASHVLEHQLNVSLFLKKIYSILSADGILAITVPPLKHEIAGGHVTLWNAGLLLYNLVLAGFDCRDAKVLRYGYNISVILRKRAVQLPELAFDRGDIDRLSSFFPAGFCENFHGNIYELNW